MTHPQLSVGRRLAAGFGLIIIVFVALVAFVAHWHARSVHVQAAYAERVVPLTAFSHRLREDVLRTALAVRDYTLSRTARERAAYDGARDAVIASVNGLRMLQKGADGESLVFSIGRALQDYISVCDRVVRGVDAGSVSRREVAQLVQLREAVMDPIERMLQMQEESSAAALAAMSDARDTVSTALDIGATIGALLCLALAYLTGQWVRRPLKELLRLAGDMKAGRWANALAYVPREGAPGANGAPVRNEMLSLRNAFAEAAAALESRERRLRADRAIATALSRSLETAQVSADALRALADYARAEVGVVYRWAEASGTLDPVATLGCDDAPAVRSGEGIPGQAAKERRALVVADIPADSGFAIRLGYDRAPPRTVLAAPILFGDELVGVIVVASLRRFPEEEVAFIEEAARTMAVGLKNAAAYERIQRLYGELREKSEALQAQNEEIQAQNEEIQAQHEELQAQREEIEAQTEQLREQNERLLNRAVDLDRDNAALQQADERKNEFLGFLAHELRNPMAAISNSLHVVRRGQAGAAQEGKALDILERQVRHLTRIIDDLLDITRISRGKIELTRTVFDAVGMVRDCIEDHCRLLEAKALELDLALPGEALWVDGDRTRLCQILGNLLNNAIKFTGNGSRVRVALGLEADGRNVRLTVSDSGMGIDPALLPEVFKPFSQGESGLARTNAGLGLGLALVKMLAELHGGRVEAHSDGPGQGARFDVLLPVVCEPVMSVADVAVAPAPRRILVVEDSADAAASLKAVLELEGHTVEVAHDAEGCFASVSREPPDVVLCDIGLPGMDGYEIARRLRAEAGLPPIALIALTGYASEDDRQRAEQAGFDCHLSKPVDLRALNRELRRLERGTSSGC